MTEEFEREVKRSAVLLKLMTKIYLHSVPVAFLKWKTITKIQEKDYQKYAKRTEKMGKLLEIYLDGKKAKIQNAFNFWKF